jgi:hypothetical protein
MIGGVFQFYLSITTVDPAVVLPECAEAALFQVASLFPDFLLTLWWKSGDMGPKRGPSLLLHMCTPSRGPYLLPHMCTPLRGPSLLLHMCTPTTATGSRVQANKPALGSVPTTAHAKYKMSKLPNFPTTKSPKLQERRTFKIK